MNTLGNWSDDRAVGNYGDALYRFLPQVPGTEQNIFRDFPDVFSEEYRLDAEECAKAMQAKAGIPGWWGISFGMSRPGRSWIIW